MATKFLTHYDARVVGEEIEKSEDRVVPTIAPYEIRLEEVPMLSSQVTITGLTEVSSDPGPGEFRVDYLTGKITFNAFDYGMLINPQYYGKGSLVEAADINLIQGAVNDVEDEIEVARGTSPSLNDRLSASLNDDGTLAINTINPSSINQTPPSEFIFPSLKVTGDLTVEGTQFIVHSEDVELDSTFLTLNAGATLASDAGIYVNRGVTGVPDSSLQWNESAKSWDVHGITGVCISASESVTTLSSDKVVITKLVQVGKYSSDPVVSTDDIGGVFYNTTDHQFKGVAGTVGGGYEITVLG